MELSDSGGYLDSIQEHLAGLRERLVDGEKAIPPWRAQGVVEFGYDAFGTTHAGQLDFVDGVCSSGPNHLTEGDVLGITASGGVEAGVVRVLEGAELPTVPVPVDEPVPDLDLSGTVTGPSIQVPVFEGTWWVACMTSELVYPVVEIEVAPDD